MAKGITLQELDASALVNLVPHLGTTSNSGDAYSITTSATIGVNQKFTIKFNEASSSAPTLKINNGKAYPIKKQNGNIAKIYPSVYSLFWDETNFILQGEGGGGTAIANDIRAGKTATTDFGDITGNLVTCATGATMITPISTDQVLSSGIYDGNITIKGANIKEDSSFAPKTWTYNDMYDLAVNGKFLKMDVDNATYQTGSAKANYYTFSGTLINTVTLTSGVYNRLLNVDKDGIYLHTNPTGMQYNNDSTIAQYDHSGNFVKTIVKPSTSELTSLSSLLSCSAYLLFYATNGSAGSVVSYTIRIKDLSGNLVINLSWRYDPNDTFGSGFPSFYYFSGYVVAMIGGEAAFLVNYNPVTKTVSQDFGYGSSGYSSTPFRTFLEKFVKSYGWSS